MAFEASDDLSALLLVHSASGNVEGIRRVADAARTQSKANVAVMAYLLLNEIFICLEVLLECKRFPEAAFFARSYCPSGVSHCVKLWKEDVSKLHPKLAASIADPESNSDLFSYGTNEDRFTFAHALEAEKAVEGLTSTLPARAYTTVKQKLESLKVLDMVAAQGGEGFAKAWGEGLEDFSISPRRSSQKSIPKKDSPRSPKTVVPVANPNPPSAEKAPLDGSLPSAEVEVVPMQTEEISFDPPARQTAPSTQREPSPSTSGESKDYVVVSDATAGAASEALPEDSDLL